jgi:hypothetical protein
MRNDLTMGVYQRKSWSRAFLNYVRQKRRREEAIKRWEESNEIPF